MSATHGHGHGHGSGHDHAHGQEHGHARGHAHAHAVDPSQLGWRLVASLAINVVILAAQLVGGVLSGSLALITDALHNLSDVAALALSYVAYRVARRPADARYTFAFQRAEILAALFSAAALIAVSSVVAVQAVERLAAPEPVRGGLVMAFAAFGMVANAGAALLLRGHGSNLNLRAAMLHLVSDSVASLGVLAAGFAMSTWGWLWLDPVVSLVLAAWMIKESWSLVRGAVRILMQAVPEAVELDLVQAAMAEVPGVAGVHDLHVWALSSDDIIASAHVVVDDMHVSASTEVVGGVKRVLQDRFGVRHTTLEIECVGGGCAGAACGLCPGAATDGG